MSIGDAAVQPAHRVGVVPRRLLRDERLARLAAAGDTVAFEAIFERYHQELYRYCRAILSNHEEAQDALQSTMAAALRSLPGEDREIALRPWLYRVAHNEAISIARRRAESPLVLDAADGASAQGADSESADRERLRELVTDLHALPERQRGALVMRELSDLGYAEIGAAISSSEGAARQLVYEAREALRAARRGREMECVSVREAISERDGRRLRGRALRAHLRTCEGCKDFRAGISVRTADLRAIAPPLPALAAMGVLSSVLGGAGKGGAGAALGSAGGAGGIAAAGAGTAVLGKGGAMVAAVVLGAGALGASGAVDLPGGSAADQPAASDAAGGSSSAGHAGEDARGSAASAGGAANAEHGQGAERGQGAENRSDGHGSNGAGSSTGTPGAHGQAGEHGNGSPALGTGTEHELPEAAAADDPPGAAVGSPHTSASSGSTLSPPAPEQAEASSNAGSIEPPEQSNTGGKGANPNA
jgi:RNA polymerase sigma factor (sigma-70 family)